MKLVEGIAFLVFIVILFVYDVRKISQRRLQIKVRANKEFDEETELTIEELESRIGEAELMYEDLEQTYWMHVSAFIGISTYFYWHLWYASVAIAAATAFIGYKYLSVKPFTTSIPEI